ncbi:hypothetical protein [Wolbachia endosymbiont (group B) of Limnophora tigrina]|uniref:hypothetical protein n=1 Tax=Wolbachia endosymbiont (group B) of Limnophora tigrina TaxID=3139317 RepID=UPI003978C948
MAKRQPSSRYVLAGSVLRDTANESRYDVGLQVSSQCLTLGSSFLVILPKMFARLQSIFLDPSVTHWDDIIGALG